MVINASEEQISPTELIKKAHHAMPLDIKTGLPLGFEPKESQWTSILFEPHDYDQRYPIYIDIHPRHILGKGGGGTVYKAYHSKLGILLAAKVISHFSIDRDPRSVQLEKEAKTQASLDHPGIIKVYGFYYFPDKHESIMLMEYIKSCDLSEVLDREGMQFSLDRTLQITVQISEALDYLDSKGIVHRDPKPENILLSKGNAKLADLGSSTAVFPQGQGDLSPYTPPYTAPEYHISADDVTAKADQYSLGMIFYKMITGELLFEGKNFLQLSLDTLNLPYSQADQQRLIRALEKRSQGMKALGKNGLSRSQIFLIDSIVAKCLDKNPHNRFATALDFAHNLVAAFSNNLEDIHVN